MRNATGSVSTVLLLGGGSDIGLAITEALVAGGARTVVLAARRPGGLDDAEQRLRAAGATTVDRVPFDLDDVDGHPAVVDGVLARHGDVDVAVLAAGVLGDEQAHRDPGRVVAVARTNFVGPVSVLTVLADRLSGQGHGRIVVLSSVAGERVRRSNYVYGASKAGLDGFSQGLADSLAGSGVSVLVVRPGFVASKMTSGMQPAPMSTTPQAVAAATVAGLASGAHTVWVPGVLRLVMSGLRHTPRAVFRRLPL